MTRIDGLGFVAAGLVLGTFCMKRLVPLRTLAIGSNLAFILYPYAAGIEPVLVLHLVLMPVNLIRLLEALRAGAPAISLAAGRELAQAGSKPTVLPRTIRRQSSPYRETGA
jgi:hypothetical protein